MPNSLYTIFIYLSLLSEKSGIKTKKLLILLTFLNKYMFIKNNYDFYFLFLSLVICWFWKNGYLSTLLSLFLVCTYMVAMECHQTNMAAMKFENTTFLKREKNVYQLVKTLAFNWFLWSDQIYCSNNLSRSFKHQAGVN